MNTVTSSDGWTTHPQALEQAPAAKRMTRIYARFRDGHVLSKRRAFGAERFAWQLTWEGASGARKRACGWAHSEASAQKCLARERRKLWSGDHDVTEQIVPINEGVLKGAKDGHDRYLKVHYPPSNANQLWADACKRGRRFLILNETAKFYTISILGDEYRVSKKELTISGPWKGSPVFMKMFKG